MRLPICLLHIILFSRFLFICFRVTYSVWGPGSDPACLRGPGLEELWKRHVPLGCTPHTPHRFPFHWDIWKSNYDCQQPFDYSQSILFLAGRKVHYVPQKTQLAEPRALGTILPWHFRGSQDAHLSPQVCLQHPRGTGTSQVSQPFPSGCDTVCLLHKCFKTQRRPAPNKQHSLVTSS